MHDDFTQRQVGHEDELALDRGTAGQVAGIYAGQGIAQVSDQRGAAQIVAEMATGAQQLLDRRW